MTAFGTPHSQVSGILVLSILSLNLDVSKTSSGILTRYIPDLYWSEVGTDSSVEYIMES